MKTKTLRSRKHAGHYLSSHINSLSQPLRYICTSSRPPHATLCGIDAGKLKYLLNTSLLLLFALLHTADGIVTYFGLKFNYAAEVNPVLIFFASTMGLGLSIFALKLLCVEFIAWLFLDRRNIGSCWGTATLFSADAFYSWVVSNNILLVMGA